MTTKISALPATSIVLPFRGDDYRARRNANAAARRATCSPQVRRIVGGWVGVGDLVTRKGGADRMLYGREGTTEWMSEVIARGAMTSDWL
jgi:hypothetical protein